MEGRASVEVFEREERDYFLIVEPREMLKGVYAHLKSQPEEVEVRESFLAGDFEVRLLNGKPLDEVLGRNVLIRATHPARREN